jgi:opacity protein-like surface antigen
MSRIFLFFITAALLFSSTNSFAQDWETNPLMLAEDETPSDCYCQTEACLNNGFYLGIGVGYDWYSVQRKIHATILDDPLFNEKVHVNPNGVMGTLFLGYGRSLKSCCHLGVEGFIDLSNARSHVMTTVFSTQGPFLYTTKTTAELSYGVNLLPGYKWRDSSLVYLKFGYTQTRIKEEEREFLLSSANGRPFLKSNVHRYANGFTLGLGFEEAICWKLSLRGEFNHTFYPSFTNTYSSFVSSAKTKHRPSNTEFVLSLIWHFGESLW